MEILVSTIVAYVLCGIWKVLLDFSGDMFTRAPWTYRATPLHVAAWVAVWPVRCIFKVRDLRRASYLDTGLEDLADVVAGLSMAVWELAPITMWIWMWVRVAGYLADPLVYRVPLAALLIAIGNAVLLPFVLPLFTLVTSPLGILYGSLIQLVLTPLRKGRSIQERAAVPRPSGSVPDRAA